MFGVGLGVGLDELGLGSAVAAGVEGVDRIAPCRSQFASKPSNVSTLRLAERTPESRLR
jgi:hypothetical protein